MHNTVAVHIIHIHTRRVMRVKMLICLACFDVSGDDDDDDAVYLCSLLCPLNFSFCMRSTIAGVPTICEYAWVILAFLERVRCDYDVPEVRY